VCVFKLSELEARLNIAVPEAASRQVRGAYLCLRRIPEADIIRLETMDHAEEGVRTGTADQGYVMDRG